MFVRTDRLLLRPGFCEDAPALHAALADPAVARNLARVPAPYRLGDAERFLALDADPARPNLLVFRRTFAAPELIGGVGLADLGHGVELGYWIARAHWGLGYATEAADALVRHADALRLPRLVSGHFADNPASGRVLRKLGFAPTGVVAGRESLARGGVVPCVMFARESANAAEPRPLAA